MTRAILPSTRHSCSKDTSTTTQFTTRPNTTTETKRTREDAPKSTEKQRVCPECGGSLSQDTKHGETICRECGLVVDEAEIDHGPDWRAFDSEERDQKSRVGAPTTKLMHDKGLSTKIDWQNRDGYGNSLSSQQRQKMQRLRTWDERFRTRNSKERNLKQALGEIERMGSALGVPKTVRETASVIYRRALEDDLLPGRSIEGIVTAAIYAAVRQAAIPRSVDEVAAVSRVDEVEFKRAYRYLGQELGLEIQPPDPEDYIAKYASALNVSGELETRAHELLQTAKAAHIHSGKNPIGLAGAALYAAGLLTNETLTQSEVAEVTNVSEVTIRNRYQELLETAGQHPETMN